MPVNDLHCLLHLPNHTHIHTPRLRIAMQGANPVGFTDQIYWLRKLQQRLIGFWHYVIWGCRASILWLFNHHSLNILLQKWEQRTWSSDIIIFSTDVLSNRCWELDQSLKFNYNEVFLFFFSIFFLWISVVIKLFFLLFYYRIKSREWFPAKYS